MAAEELSSIEMALAAAALVLGARLAALVAAQRGLTSTLEGLGAAWRSGDVRSARAGIRKLSKSVPFGDFGSDWLAALDQPTGTSRKEALAQAERFSVRRVIRRAARGQALDLAAIALLSGLGAFANAALRLGSFSWWLGAALVLLLIASVAVRGSLGHAVRSTLEGLTPILSENPPQADGPAAEPCERCGAPLADRELKGQGANGDVTVSAQYCGSCGLLTAEVDPRAFLKPAE